VTDLTIMNGGRRVAVSTFGSADAQPLIFLHGVSMSRDTWEEIASQLMDRFNVWTLDFRGHGHSDWTPSYALADYQSDAEALLEHISRPTTVIGHSLGGCVAGLIAQDGHPHMCGAILEDPPWFLGERAEWDRTAFPRLFAIITERQATWRKGNAPLSIYLDFLANAPLPNGATAKDFVSARHLLSHASALQRQDLRCWGEADEGVTGSALTAIDTSRPFLRPVMVIRGEDRLGAAFPDKHCDRLQAVNPVTDIVQYLGCGHHMHRMIGFEQRFAEDVLRFISYVDPV
jgi:pimeloyl-ACP methyl ester carboxylesterase